MNTVMNSKSAGTEHKRLSMPLVDLARDGTFSGYASLFGKVDLGKDRVVKGAFRRSLEARKVSGIRMLFQHDPAEPIGKWDAIYEDARGLFVKGKIVQQTARGREVLSLMREGAIDGLSIGFRTNKSHTDRKTGIRNITQADLWEVSIVTFPMLPQARVADVKSNQVSLSRTIPSVREFERWLTRDAGLTRSEARTVIGKGFAHLAGKQDAAAPTIPGLDEKIRQATNHLNARR